MNKTLVLNRAAKPRRPLTGAGRPTVYLPGYPTGDGKPMSATNFHGCQISTLFNQLTDRYGLDSNVYVGIDSFVYYRFGGEEKKVAPNIYVVPGVPARPVRRSFYTWMEGAVPAVVFEFLSEETEKEDKGDKKKQYFEELGIQEYFLHQPEGAKPREFLGWRRTEAGVEEIPEDEQGRRYSEVLDLWLVAEDQPNEVRLLRPYEPDGTPLPTLTEAREEAEEQGFWRMVAEERARQSEERAQSEVQARAEAEERAAAEVRARQEEARARQEAEARAREAAERAQSEAQARAAAAERVQSEAQARAAAEAEAERLRAELARFRGTG